ncbi:hypothetical protein HDE_04895 [Halotydeus destructor]|nr:hypothetical protein HDE_04895 [Halotydeus destructor]
MVHIWPLFAFMVMVNGGEVTNKTTAATVTSMAATAGMVTTVGPGMAAKGNSTDNGKQYVPILDEGLLSLLTTRAPVTEAPPSRELVRKEEETS